MNIQDVRSKFPQYNDLSDDQLAQALHKKYYADLPYETFTERIGLKAKPVAIGKEAFPAALKETMGGYGMGAQVLAGAGTALDDAAMRLKQMVVGLRPQDEARIEANRAMRDQSTPAMLGNVGGNIAMLAAPGANAQIAMTQLAGRALPGAVAPVAAAAATGGAISAATEPVLGDETTLGKAAMGALGGAAGQAAGQGLARVVGGPIKQSPQVQTLLKEGVVPTPGQAAGANSFLGRIEQKLSSVPVVGDIIKKARDRATEEFDLAAISRSLPKNSRGQITKAGREAIDQADAILGRGYDDVLSRVTVKPDQQFGASLSAILNDPDLALPADQKKRFVEVLNQSVAARFQNGELSGDLAKRADSQLGALARRYMGDADGDKRALGLAFRQAQSSFRDLIERNAAPEDAAILKELNKSYANFLRVERAASMVGANEGVFSASQLQNAVKAMDSSRNKGQFAKGQALMQDLSEAGKSVLGDTVPNSGTADRALLAALLGGGLNEALGGPGVLTALAMSPLAYSRTGSRYLIGDLPAQAAFEQALRRGAPYAAQVGRAVTDK